MKIRFKIILAVVAIVALVLIASVLYISFSDVNGKDISDFISEQQVEKLKVRKYILDFEGQPILVQEETFELGAESVDELGNLFENSDFKSTNKLYEEFVKSSDEYVEYVIHGVNDEGQQCIHIKSTSVEIKNQDSSKVFIENGIVITMYDVNAPIATVLKEYMFTSKDKNWRYNLEEILYPWF